jgi:two-component system, LytTR family, response regulator
MSELKILIVDDELPARKKLLTLLKNVPQKFQVDEAANGIEAVKKINEVKPDLIFLDIQMPGMNGFEVIETIGVDKMPCVVFVTAYDQYALNAFDVNAVDYLLKPFDKARFLKAFEKLIGKKTNDNNLTSLLDTIGKEKKIVERFLVNHASKYFFVQAEDILYISSDEKYVKLHTSNGIFMIRETMNNMEEKLNREKFARIHRSFIVNVSQIKEMQPWSHGDYVVIIKNGEKLTMSRRYRGNLING